MFLRGGLGIILGVLLGVGGLIIAFWVLPGLTPPIWALVSFTGMGAGVAAFLSWLKPEAPRRVILTGLFLAFLGGIVGAWLGFMYGKAFYPDGVRNVAFVASTMRSPPVFTWVNGAVLFSTGLASVYYGIRLWRYHEV